MDVLDTSLRLTKAWSVLYLPYPFDLDFRVRVGPQFLNKAFNRLQQLL